MGRLENGVPGKFAAAMSNAFSKVDGNGNVLSATRLRHSLLARTPCFSPRLKTSSLSDVLAQRRKNGQLTDPRFKFQKVARLGNRCQCYLDASVIRMPRRSQESPSRAFPAWTLAIPRQQWMAGHRHAVADIHAAARQYEPCAFRAGRGLERRTASPTFSAWDQTAGVVGDKLSNTLNEVKKKKKKKKNIATLLTETCRKEIKDDKCYKRNFI